MKNQHPELTGAQFEIVRQTWQSSHPMTVTELWELISASRPIARTTVLTWVQRLEKRGWLRRCETAEGIGYRATRAPDDNATSTAVRIIDSFFQGSPSSLVMALGGRGHIDSQEIARLREVLTQLEQKNEGAKK